MAEAQARWGQTEAYQAFAAKGRSPSHKLPKSWPQSCLHFRPAQRSLIWMTIVFREQVKVLQDYISQHFYPCDQTVLAGLGQMYQTDNPFLALSIKSEDQVLQFFS